MAISQTDISVGSRLEKVVELTKSKNPRQLAIALGIDPSQFTKYQKGIAALPLEKIVELSSKFGISLEWLITGVGEEFRKEKADTAGVSASLAADVRTQMEEMSANLLALAKKLPAPLGPEITSDPSFARTKKGADKTKKND